MKMKYINQGFTFAELIITVAVFGILSGASFITFSKNWEGERVKAATREATAWLEEARKVAIQTSMPCRLSINTGNATLSLDTNAPEEDTNIYCDQNNLAQLALRSRIKGANELRLCLADLNSQDPSTINLPCTNNQNGESFISFTPRGTAVEGVLLKLHLTDTSSDRCIAVISPMGQIRSGRSTNSGCDFTTAY